MSKPNSTPLIRVDYTAEGRRRPFGYRHTSGRPYLFALPHSAGIAVLRSETAAETLIPLQEAAKLADAYRTVSGTPVPVEALRDALASLRIGDAVRVRLYNSKGQLTFTIREGSLDSTSAVDDAHLTSFFRCFQATADAPVVSARLANAESVISVQGW